MGYLTKGCMLNCMSSMLPGHEGAQDNACQLLQQPQHQKSFLAEQAYASRALEKALAPSSRPDSFLHRLGSLLKGKAVARQRSNDACFHQICDLPQSRLEAFHSNLIGPRLEMEAGDDLLPEKQEVIRCLWSRCSSSALQSTGR